MKIKVIDAFGTHVGDAEVKWIPMGDTPKQQRTYLTRFALEIATIFDKQLTVTLPTRNPQVPWRLEIDTDG